jgi:lipid-A-disaccharide synthase
VFISVADPSGDLNAALVVGEIRRLGPVELRGVGGPAMAAAGVGLLRDTVAGSAMGLAALFRAREVSRLLGEIEASWQRDRPNLVICCDSWSMNVHVARRAKAMGIPVLYYIAPQAWASREGRAEKLARVADRVACILPFEPPWFRERGVRQAEYVGHPLWDRIHVGGVPSVGTAEKVVAVLPGSRRGVAKANWPRLLEVMRGLEARVPGVRFRVAVARNAAEVVRATAGVLPAGTQCFDGENAMDELLPGCSMALCVSGTAALHVAAHGVPMVVLYHVNPLAWHLVGRWVVRTRTYSLVNLLADGPERIASGHRVAPEFIPWYGSTEPVMALAAAWLADPAELARRRGRVLKVVEPLAKPGASRRVAEMAWQMLGP